MFKYHYTLLSLSKTNIGDHHILSFHFQWASSSRHLHSSLMGFPSFFYVFSPLEVVTQSLAPCYRHMLH